MRNRPCMCPQAQNCLNVQKGLKRVVNWSNKHFDQFETFTHAYASVMTRARTFGVIEMFTHDFKFIHIEYHSEITMYDGNMVNNRNVQNGA